MRVPPLILNGKNEALLKHISKKYVIEIFNFTDFERIIAAIHQQTFKTHEITMLMNSALAEGTAPE